MKKYLTFAVVLMILALGSLAVFNTRASNNVRTVTVIGPSCDEFQYNCSIRELMDLPSIPAQTTMDFKVFVPGAVIEEDAVNLTPNGGIEDGLVWTGYEINTEDGVFVVLRVGNITNSAINPAPRKWRATIFKFTA